VPSDDELRRVAEDVRALARSLGRDIRAALDRTHEDLNSPEGSDAAGRRSAREDLAAAGRAARDELRAAQIAVRESARKHRRSRDDRRRPGYGPSGLGTGCPPRWDNWGGHRHHDHPGGRPDADPGRSRRARRDTRHPERLTVPTPPAPPLRHRHDGTTLVGLLAVVFGLAWLAAGTHVASVSTEAVLAVALMVVGAATVVTARTDWALSSRKWPVLGGGAVAIALLAFAASPGLPVGFQHPQVGSLNFAPATWSDLPATIHGGFGKTTVLLASLPTPLPAATTLLIDNAAGRLEITLPPDLRVLLDAHVAAGQIMVNGAVTSGMDHDHGETLSPSAVGPPLTLHVEAGFSSVDIEQNPLATAGPDAPLKPLPPKTPVNIK
jgi:hypothetical protein